MNLLDLEGLEQRYLRGWGEELFDYLDAPVIRLGGEEMPPPYNPNLERKIVPQVEDIVWEIKKLVG